MGFFGKRQGATRVSSPAPAEPDPPLDAPFIDGILHKTGFPATDHNRVAVCAILHVMLRNKACDYITYDKPQSVADRFVNEHPLKGRNTSLEDLTGVVSDVVRIQPASAPYMGGEHVTAEGILLDVASKRGGMFENGPNEPLLVFGES